MYRWMTTLFITLIVLTAFTTTAPVNAASSDNRVATWPTVATTITAFTSKHLEVAEVAQPETLRCRVVTAETLTIYGFSSGTAWEVGKLRRGNEFHTTGITNNRYNLYDVASNSLYGWVSADPRWTDYVGSTCYI